MEISTTVVTHIHTDRDAVLSTPQKPNAVILKNLYSEQFVTTLLHGGSSDAQEHTNALSDKNAKDAHEILKFYMLYDSRPDS